jgi:peptidyl-prolyl cis-trans isomerase C
MKFRHVPILLACLMLFAGGCKKEKQPQGTILAQVGNDKLYEESFKSVFSEEEWASMDSETRKKYIQDWVNLTLLAQESQKMGLNNSLEVKQKLDFATKKVKANALIADRMADLEISENELFAYYRIHRGEFDAKALEYNVQRIYVEDQHKAQQLLTELETGADFDLMVKHNSQELLRDKLGHIGFVSPGTQDSLFWNQARELETGEFAMFAADGGWYIIRQLGSRESDKDLMFDDLRSQIRTRILAERQQTIYEDLLKEIKSKHTDVYYY